MSFWCFLELEKAIYFSCFTGLDNFDLFSLKTDLFESDDVGRTKKEKSKASSLFSKQEPMKKNMSLAGLLASSWL